MHVSDLGHVLLPLFLLRLTKMNLIGEAKGIKLYSPKDSYISYFNSPYFGHAHASAIDVYPHHHEWGGPVVSPIAGKLVHIQKTTMGRQKEFPTDDYDFGIALQPDWTEDAIVRILHCRPNLEEGSVIDKGDMIGTAIRSRYFNYWTGPHYHIEVMHKDSFHRSTQSYQLGLPFGFESKKADELPPSVEILIDTVTEDFIIGYPRGLSHTTINGYTGLSGISNGKDVVGILDGGLSHYKHGGVIGHSDSIEGSIIGLQNIPVGTIERSLTGSSFFLRGPCLSSSLDGKELRGLSCFVYPKHYVKKGITRLLLIPKSYGEFVGQFSEGNVCQLKIDSTNNTIKAD